MTTTTTKRGSVKEKALIVNLIICAWSGRKLDKKITREVEEQHNATDAGNFNKLLVDKKDLEPLTKIATAFRTFHRENTLPWGDNGDRLLPSANYFDYTKKAGDFKNQYEAEKNILIDRLDEIKTAARIRLNGMYNESDYPNKAQLEAAFNTSICFLPMPETDFRIDLNDTEVNILRQSVENEVTARIQAAVGDIWERIKKQLQAMKERLSDPNAVFRNSLFDNLADIIELLPKLNVTGDADLTDVCNQMQTLLVNPESVRENSNLRNQKAQEVNDLLNKFSDFFGG